MTKNILVSWIGHTDLRAMAAGSPEEVKEKINSLCGLPKKEDGLGPVRTALTNQPFNAVYLLSNYSDSINRLYKKWIGKQIEFIPVSLDNPTDYKKVFTVTDKALSFIKASNSDYSLHFLLSPGTPAMAAIFVLLGKTRYPAKFLQTFKNQLHDTEIPFDITVDFIPELFNPADKSLEQLIRLSPKDVPGFEKIIGNSKSIRLAVGRAQRAALRDISVLLMGESGTGKELFARAIHAVSIRKDKPFEVVNCAAIPKELMESELFGHVKGAFTGATTDHDGAFKRADGGILFLDEIGECTPEIQAKLLRVMQPTTGQYSSMREIRPVGGRLTQNVNVRVIAATNRDLLNSVEKGLFRSDLYYRLAVVIICLPPLRERKSDIEAIAQSILEEINKAFENEKQEPGYRHKYLCDSAKYFVKSYSWPGNVRELYNVLIQAAVMSTVAGLSREDLEQSITGTGGGKQLIDQANLPIGGGFSLDKTINTIKKQYIERALEEAHGVKEKAARLLGIKNYQTLAARMKKLDLKAPE